jgi:hypothetical protein
MPDFCFLPLHNDVINRLAHNSHVETVFFAERKQRLFIRDGENFVTGGFQNQAARLQNTAIDPGTKNQGYRRRTFRPCEMENRTTGRKKLSTGRSGVGRLGGAVAGQNGTH